MPQALEKKARYCPSCRCAVGDWDQYCPSCETGKPALGWPEDLYIGRVVGKKYRMEKRVSAGGFGIVFLATHLHQEVEIGKVIIKMLHPEHSFEATVKRRFINEAKAARTINSPHVVRVFDLDYDEGMVPYMVQEYVEGVTLGSLILKEGKIDLTRAVSISIQIAGGMKEAHDRGILHRDLKPENIILQNEGRNEFVKIIDFGIARLETQSSLATASLVGTPRYMSPEQIQGKTLDKRSDIFSLGVMIFEMITGRPPIEAGESELEYLNLNLQKEPRSITDLEPWVPEGLSRLVASMIEKDPEKRPPDMGAVVEELAAIADAQGWKADHTGSYRLAGEKGAEEGKTLTEVPVHEAPTEKLPSLPREPEQQRRFVLAVVAAVVLSVATALTALGIFIFFGDGESKPATALAGAPDAALDEVGGGSMDAMASPEPPEPDLLETPVEKEAHDAKPPERKKTWKKKKKRDPWTKI